MLRVLTAIVMLWIAIPAWAGPGDPVVGQIVAVDRIVVGVRWQGTDDDLYHRHEAAELGGFTLFASYSPGGAIIARMPFPWPPPPSGEEEVPGRPVFFVGPVPDGRYYVVVVRGIVAAPLAPASAWSEVVVNVGTCGSAPGAPVNLWGQGVMPGGSVRVNLGWSDGAGCPPEAWEIVAGYSPGASDAANVPWGSRGFSAVAPPGTYYVRVHAANQVGRSGPSNEVRIDVQHPGCTGPGPTPSLTSTVVGNQVTLNWHVPSQGSSPVTLYQISAGSNPGLSNVANIYVGANPRTFTTTAPPGRYYVRVSAGNGCGGHFSVGAPSNEVIIDVP
jgi:hypothetical protein